MTHPSFGKYTKEQIQEMINKPLTTVTYHIDDEQTVKSFTIHVSRDRNVVVQESAIVTVDAVSEDDARKIIDDMDWEDFEWEEEDSYTNDTDGYQIESIEQTDDDENSC